MLGDLIRVLLVEDDPGYTRLVREYLSAGGAGPSLPGYGVTIASRLSEALQRLTEAQFDVALIDLSLPDSFGLDTFRQIHVAAPRAALIVLSGNDDDQVAVQAMHEGAQDYMAKGRADEYSLTRSIRYAIERKQAEGALRDSEERFRRAIQDAPYPIQIHAEDGEVLTINQAWADLTGYGLTDIPTIQAWTEKAYGGRAKMIEDEIKNLYASKHRVDEGEEEIQTAAGEVQTWKFSSAPLGNLPDGRRLVISMAVDLTERKLAEEKIRQSEENFSKAFLSSPAALMITRLADGRYIELNEAYSNLVGYDRTELLGHLTTEFNIYVNPDQRREIANELLTKGTLHNYEAAIQNKSGEPRIVIASLEQIQFSGEDCILTTMLDVTERKLAEEKIKRQLKQLGALRTIDTAISSSFDIHVTLDIVLKETLSQLGVDAAAVLLLNSYDQSVEYAAGRGFHSEAIQQSRMKVGTSLAGRSILEGRALYISNLRGAGDQFTRAALLADEKFISYYCLPLAAKGETKGVLEIFQRTLLNPGPEWVDFLETLAGQAAIAIDNAQLFEGLQRINAELEQRVTKRTVELNQMNIELEHANRTKDEFLATMSHELRTPLNSVLGLSETLLEQRRGPLNEYQQKSLKTIEASGRHLLELINDVLDLAKIEAGKFDYYPQVVGVNDLCHSSLAFVKEQALRKSINLTYAEDPNVSKVNADPRRLKQILINLLTNAVKFTPEKGSVILQVHGDTAQERVQFSIIDTGIGIAQSDLAKLFQPFVQVDSSLNRQFEGTGLGLTLVQKMIDLHGGSVEVFSEMGKGSRFTINLPWIQESAAGQTSRAANPDAAAADKPVEPALILLAEDNVANILTIGDYLESHGYQIISANNGQEAIDKAIELQPAVILMDIQMPMMDGLEAIRRLRADSRFQASTPIIALTALAMPGDRERCLEAGATEYMSKPVSLKVLLKTIQTLYGAQA